jgi:hypothetical protein
MGRALFFSRKLTAKTRDVDRLELSKPVVKINRPAAKVEGPIVKPAKSLFNNTIKKFS